MQILARLFPRPSMQPLRGGQRPTLTGAAGAHAYTRRLRGKCGPRLTKGNGQGREQHVTSYPHRVIISPVSADGTLQRPRPYHGVATASGRSPTTPHHRSLGEPRYCSTPQVSLTAGRQTRVACATRVFTGGWRDVMEPDIIPIATTAGGAGVVFSREERERHVYIVGKSGSGKSTFLFNLAMGDILAGEGVAVIDPHGDLALDILDAIPRSRINDVCYLDVTDAERPVGFNPATRVPPERRALAAAGIVSAFKHLWSDSWGPRLEHFLFHGVAALVSREHATLIDLPRVYTDDNFRDRLLRSVEDPETLRFWQRGISELHKSISLGGLRADS